MPVFNCKPPVNVEFYTGKTSVNTGKQDIRQVLTDRQIPENMRFPAFTVMGKYRICNMFFMLLYWFEIATLNLISRNCKLIEIFELTN